MTQPADGSPGGLQDQPIFLTHLGGELEDALEHFAERETVVVGLDFDGVLAPIVLDPTTAHMLPATAEAVARLAAAPGVDVAVVTGRSAHDVVALAALPTGTRVIGSHGAEWGRSVDTGDGPVLESEPLDLTEEQVTLLRDLERETMALAAEVDGAWVQTKPTAVVLHTRRLDAATAEALTRRTLDGPAARDGVRVVVGKQVVEMAVLEVTKGDAMVRLKNSAGASAAFYAGDDTTDEDAFRSLDLAAGDVTVKVGAGETAAGYRVTDPEEFSVVLMRLVDLFESRTAPLPELSQETDTHP